MVSESIASSYFTYKRQKIRTSILFLAAPLVLLLVFNYLPALNMFLYSFAQWDGFGPIDDSPEKTQATAAWWCDGVANHRENGRRKARKRWKTVRVERFSAASGAVSTPVFPVW